MNVKITIPAIALSLLLIMGGYVLINPSYQKSIQAKYYFEIGEYDEAYTLANEAFSLDVYNRMASTIMAQSKTSLKYVEYIDMARGYMVKINEIAKHDSITDADRAKIKIMSKIVVDSYVKLAPSVITDTDLVEDAAYHHKSFEQLLEKVDR
ncbi:MAG: hypothetical protein U9Q40_06245 [Campylobacterota bacterium]|nr:hypothetical protein [Campylobacterota bacterium]